jgi:hypothetical protein
LLFNSYTFLLVFLPIALLGWHALRRAPFRVVLGWLVMVSFVFYGVWNPDPKHPWSPQYVLLILGSCVFNYLLGRQLSRLHREGGDSCPPSGSSSGRQESRPSAGYAKNRRRFARLSIAIASGLGV